MIIENITTGTIILDWAAPHGLKMAPQEQVEIDDAIALTSKFKMAKSAGVISINSWDNSDYSSVVQKELKNSSAELQGDISVLEARVAVNEEDITGIEVGTSFSGFQLEFYYLDMPITVIDKQMWLSVGTFKDKDIFKEGYLVGIDARILDILVSGTLEIKPRKNEVFFSETDLNLVLDNSTPSHVSAIIELDENFAFLASDNLDVVFTSSEIILTENLDLSVTLYILSKLVV